MPLPVCRTTGTIRTFLLQAYKGFTALVYMVKVHICGKQITLKIPSHFGPIPGFIFCAPPVFSGFSFGFDNLTSDFASYVD